MMSLLCTNCSCAPATGRLANRDSSKSFLIAASDIGSEISIEFDADELAEELASSELHLHNQQWVAWLRWAVHRPRPMPIACLLLPACTAACPALWISMLCFAWDSLHVCAGPGRDVTPQLTRLLTFWRRSPTCRDPQMLPGPQTTTGRPRVTHWSVVCELPLRAASCACLSV
jgi:hypothetical protein